MKNDLIALKMISVKGTGNEIKRLSVYIDAQISRVRRLAHEISLSFNEIF